MSMKRMYVKILHIFCLPLIRDGFLILIILSRKSRPVPETKQSSLCGPPPDLCRALNNTHTHTKKTLELRLLFFSHQLVLMKMQMDLCFRIFISLYTLQCKQTELRKSTTESKVLSKPHFANDFNYLLSDDLLTLRCPSWQLLSLVWILLSHL